MRLAIDEFIRSFLTHVLPGGFHRICHYGLFANGGRANNIAQARQLLGVPEMRNQSSDADSADDSEPQILSHPCPCCCGRMIIIEIFERGRAAISSDGRDPDRHIMIAITRRPIAAHICPALGRPPPALQRGFGEQTEALTDETAAICTERGFLC